MRQGINRRCECEWLASIPGQFLPLQDCLRCGREHRFGLRSPFLAAVNATQVWADYYIAYEEGGSLGSLASEIIKTDLDVHDELAGAFDQWRGIFRDGLQRMQRLGRISADADPTRLANLLLSAYKGGMLLAQIARDVRPLKDALRAAIDYVQSFTTSPDANRLQAQ